MCTSTRRELSPERAVASVCASKKSEKNGAFFSGRFVVLESDLEASTFRDMIHRPTWWVPRRGLLWFEYPWYSMVGDLFSVGEK